MPSSAGAPSLVFDDPRHDRRGDRQVSWGLDQPLSPRARNISGDVVNLVDLENEALPCSADDIHRIVDLDDDSYLSDDSDFMDDDPEDIIPDIGPTPAALKKDDVHKIPGSPWAKPRARHSKRPTEPLAIAKYASIMGFAMAFGWVIYLFIVATW